MSNKPVFWALGLDEDEAVCDEMKNRLNLNYYDIPLYTQPQKYCPSENNATYEKGFIDGMAQMTESAVHRAAEGMAVKELTDEEIQEVAHGFGAIGWMGDTTYEFARAILRKAQER